MKITICLTILSAVLLPASLMGSDRTANGILANPAKYEDQNVNLDVAFLRPVRWTSPVPDVAFFYAMTYDKRNRSFGGEILLAAPEATRDTLVRRYGVTRDGGKRKAPSTNQLRAVLRSTGETGQAGRSFYYLDQTDGEISEVLRQKRGELGKRLREDPSGPKDQE